MMRLDPNFDPDVAALLAAFGDAAKSAGVPMLASSRRTYRLAAALEELREAGVDDANAVALEAWRRFLRQPAKFRGRGLDTFLAPERFLALCEQAATPPSTTPGNDWTSF